MNALLQSFSFCNAKNPLGLGHTSLPSAIRFFPGGLILLSPLAAATQIQPVLPADSHISICTHPWKGCCAAHSWGSTIGDCLKLVGMAKVFVRQQFLSQFFVHSKMWNGHKINPNWFHQFLFFHFSKIAHALWPARCSRIFQPVPSPFWGDRFKLRVCLLPNKQQTSTF